MTDTVLHQSNPDDLEPEMVAIALPIYRRWEAAALRVAAHRGAPEHFALPAAEDTPEAILAERFRTLRPAVADAASAVAAARLSAPKTRHRLGKAVELEFESTRSVADLAVADAAEPVTGEALLRLVDRHYAQLGVRRTTGGAPSPTGKVRLDLVRVVCVDETDGPGGVEWGDDEIHLFGDTIDESGNTGRFRPFKIGDFSDGDRKDFTPARTLFTWNADGGTTYPQHYFAALFLVEKDQGELSPFAEKVFRRFADAVKAKITELLVELGVGLAGPFGAVVAALVAWITGWLIDKFFAFLLSVWNDDLFGPRLLEFIIPNATARLVEPSRVFHFTGPGEYAVRYQWSIRPS